MSLLGRLLGSFSKPQQTSHGDSDTPAPWPGEALLRSVDAKLSSIHAVLLWQYQVLCASAREELLGAARHASPLRLERHGYKVYSQNDEDGIIAEIFRRIGAQSRTFLEFGVGDGLENNTLHLMNQGWTGCWIEGGPADAAAIRKRFRQPIAERRLRFKEAFIDAGNINRLLDDLGLAGEIDLLSVDLDGNDYHVWKSLDRVHPRAVVIEYNPKFPPPMEWVMAYDPSHVWDHTDQFGASLESLASLAANKGYRLVGCNITGANAFFVRQDAAGSQFEEPASAAHLYQPARYYLTPGMTAGHEAGYGKAAPPDAPA